MAATVFLTGDVCTGAFFISDIGGIGGKFIGGGGAGMFDPGAAGIFDTGGGGGGIEPVGNGIGGGGTRALATGGVGTVG